MGLGSAGGRLRRNKQRRMQVNEAEEWQQSNGIDDDGWFIEDFIMDIMFIR